MDKSSLCVNGCGFYGSTENKNRCSKCYKDYLKEIIAKSDDERVTKNLKGEIIVPNNDEVAYVDVDAVSKNVVKNKNRCKICNKKVGILGFECRCGDLFCGRHRYPELHACHVDFKDIGRQTLAKQNPLCIHDKLDSRV
ncbi:hypothetical protein RIF29_13408 [Crotalaria pallida]|uniref:Zinc finger protein n=1 Tax=Crotalaria pallida TaxID=3830 RepID=A0AAN9P1X0_CROPI